MSALPLPNPTQSPATAGAALAIVPPPAAVPVSLNGTLYQIVDELQALADSLELTDEGSPERVECEAAMEAWMAELPTKVDRFCNFLAHLESQAEFAAKEIKRLQDRKKSFERTSERLEKYAIGILEKQPAPKKGARKLEGITSTLSLRPSDGVVLTNEAEVPSRFKSITVEMPADVWAELLGERAAEFSTRFGKYEQKCRLADIKTAIKKGGEEVPGADLEFRNNLRRS